MTPTRRACPDGEWDLLPPSVRVAHEAGDFAGSFDVRGGEGALARLVARVSRLPAPGRDVRVTLEVREQGDGARWTRRFGPTQLATTRLVTTQRVDSRGRLVERLGAIECAFRLLVDEHGLSYEQVGAALALGPLRVPLPRALSPRIVARVADMPAPGACHVTVGLVVPLAGLVLSYDGVVNPVTTTP
jgi:hypothetical protein